MAYMVPPALPEVRKPVSECHFHQLKEGTADPTQLHISYNHHLEPPSCKVSNKVNIKGINYVKEK